MSAHAARRFGRQVHATGLAPSVGRTQGPWSRLRAWSELVRQRRALARLDAERLQDLGLTEGEAQAEAGRPFWDAPRHWRAEPAPVPRVTLR